MRRRDVLIGAGATMAGGVALPGMAQAAPAEVVIDTASGRLRGRRDGGVSAFLGVPYGAPTRRFQPPEPVPPWTGVRDATAFGPRAPQIDMPSRPGDLGRLWRFAGGPTSEDCLVLNVWTPATDDARRPVMFWCHGGGFALGSGQEPDDDGGKLAQAQDVVVVTLNHRLNVFGFGYLAHLGGPEFADSGEVGMLDLVQGLGWVRDNIARFGGDPGNVTICGQSGGGAKVSVLLAMPPAKGLFHKAIIMSGPGVRMTERADAERNTDRLMTRLGFGKGDVDKLCTLPTAELIKAGGMIAMPGDHTALGFTPVVDGRSLPSHPFDPVAPAISAQVPIVIGHTGDEMSTLMLGEMMSGVTAAQLTRRVTATVGEARASQVLAAYRGLYPGATPTRLLIDIVTDLKTGAGAAQIAEREVRRGRTSVHKYLITWEVPALADMMSGAFAAFARTGDPQHPGLPHWPAYSLERRETMTFDTPPKVVSDPQGVQRKLWTQT